MEMRYGLHAVQGGPLETEHPNDSLDFENAKSIPNTYVSRDKFSA